MKTTKILSYGLAAMIFLLSCGKENTQDNIAETVQRLAKPSDSTAKAGSGITVIDLAGRTVQLQEIPQNVVLTRARQIYWLALLDGENPVERIAGMGSDLWKFDGHLHDYLVKTFPKTEQITDFGDIYKNDISVETVLKVNADLVLMDIWAYRKAKDNNILDNLKEADVPVLFVDSTTKAHVSTARTIAILGKVFGKETRAAAINDFISQQIQNVAFRLSKQKEKPTAIIELSGGYSKSCCYLAGSSSFGTYLEEVKAENLAVTSLGSSKANPEMLLKVDPDKVIVTGSAFGNDRPSKQGQFIPLGYRATEQTVQAAFQYLADRDYWSHMKAYQNKEVYAQWHQFPWSPLSFMGVVSMAKQIHPELFEDLDPVAVYTEFHERFMPIQFQGLFWAKMQ